MTIERRRGEQNPGQGSGISISGNNTGPLQNVVGHNISNVSQSAVAHGSMDVDSVRELLASFQAEVSQNESKLENVELLRAMADAVDTQLAAPQAEPGALRNIAQALPALVASTVVQQGGEALANAIGGLLS